MIEVSVIPEDVANARWEAEHGYVYARCVVEHAIARTLDVDPKVVSWGRVSGSIKGHRARERRWFETRGDEEAVMDATVLNDKRRWDEIRPFKFTIEEINVLDS